jgi:hypothetical protein
MLRVVPRPQRLSAGEMAALSDEQLWRYISTHHGFIEVSDPANLPPAFMERLV